MGRFRSSRGSTRSLSFLAHFARFAAIFLFSLRKPGYALNSLSVAPFVGQVMIKAILFAVAVGSAASGASAAPLFNQSHTVVGSSLTQEVKVVCEENGVCYRPPTRPAGRTVGLW